MKITWKEGRYYDLWIFVHFISGMTGGTFLLLIKTPLFYALILAIFLVVGWEIFEFVFNIKEHNENKVLDIFIGFIGFLAGYYFATLFSLPNLIVILIFCLEILILFLLSVKGWLDYKKNGRGI